VKELNKLKYSYHDLPTCGIIVVPLFCQLVMITDRLLLLYRFAQLLSYHIFEYDCRTEDVWSHVKSISYFKMCYF